MTTRIRTRKSQMIKTKRINKIFGNEPLLNICIKFHSSAIWNTFKGHFWKEEKIHNIIFLVAYFHISMLIVTQDYILSFVGDFLPKIKTFNHTSTLAHQMFRWHVNHNPLLLHVLWPIQTHSMPNQEIWIPSVGECDGITLKMFQRG